MGSTDSLALLLFERDLVFGIFQQYLRILVHLGQDAVHHLHALVQHPIFFIAFFQASSLTGSKHHLVIDAFLPGGASHFHIILYLALVFLHEGGDLAHLPFEYANLFAHLDEVVLQAFHIAFQDANGVELYKQARHPAHDAAVAIPHQIAHPGVEYHIDYRGQHHQQAGQIEGVGRQPDQPGNISSDQVTAAKDDAGQENHTRHAFGALPERF